MRLYVVVRLETTARDVGRYLLPGSKRMISASKAGSRR